MIAPTLRVVMLLALLATVATANARNLTIGIVSDGPGDWQFVSSAAILRETQRLLGEEFEVAMPADRMLEGNWTTDSVRRALDTLLRDTGVDVIVTTGVVASHVAARIPDLDKPVLAAAVVDAHLQDFPLVDGASGKRNFSYVASFSGLQEEIAEFQRVVGFRHLGVLVEDYVLKAIPQLTEKAPQLARRLESRMSVVPVRNSVDAALAALPADVDAVYVAPLRPRSDSAIAGLAAQLVARRLPGFSAVGRAGVEEGLLMCRGGLLEENIRFARRLALDIQRVLLDDDAAAIPVAFDLGTRLVINMRTARAIGFLPRWAVLVDALKLFDEEAEAGTSITLAGAMQMALEQNLGLELARYDILLAQDDMDTARAALLPSLDVAAGYTAIDEDRASPLIQSERSTSASLSGTQVIYAEQARAGYVVSRFLADAANHDYHTVVLDTLEQTATSYLNLLRARALEKVRESNLEVTRANLELARLRERIGASGQADVLRWETRIAGDRASLLEAQASRRQAAVNLNRLLHRPQDNAVSTVDSGVDKALSVMTDERFARFIGNPAVWDVFMDFSVENALRDSPELKNNAALVAAAGRQADAARRARYVPDVAIAASAGNVLSRSGAGSDLTGTGLDNDTWSIGVQASLPLFNGGALAAALARARHAERQLAAREAFLAESIETRTLAALHGVGGSYPAIELSQDAEAASRRNLALVIDAYSKGAVNVTELIDAQNAALNAALSSAEARFAFLIDYVQVLRATANFDILLGEESAAGFYRRIERYFAERGVNPLK